MSRVISGLDSKLTFPVAIVISRFNEAVTSRLLDGALAELSSRGFNDDQITVAHVPGAVEIPLVTQRFAASGQYSAIIALGAVIRGETGHYDYVCEQVSQGCQQVAQKHEVPVIFGVLTTDNAEQALARAGGSHSHKGIEAVEAAVEMVTVLREIA